MLEYDIQLVDICIAKLWKGVWCIVNIKIVDLNCFIVYIFDCYTLNMWLTLQIMIDNVTLFRNCTLKV